MPGLRRSWDGWFTALRALARVRQPARAPSQGTRAPVSGLVVVLWMACCAPAPTPVTLPIPPSPDPSPTPAAAQTPAAPALAVRRASEEVVVAAWAEPAHLDPPGGQVQILVRAQRRNGRPFAGVQVRLSTTSGSLLSRGRVLVTDAHGVTRDRLRLRQTATIVLNAGGTRYKFDVPIALAGRPF